MDQMRLGQGLKPEDGAVQSTDEATTLSVVSPDGRSPILYATDTEVDEAMKKIFEWHGPLLKKLAE